ncbi:hypothetical protein IJ596_02875, partial [bacterium]|nr:hypothetical protein [bacterium]
SADGEIHAVYEGLITKEPRYSKKFVEDIWLKIAEAGIHVHFYSSYDFDYCKYLDELHELIHYEGNFSSAELAEEMTRYDLGIYILNDNLMTYPYLKSAFGLKLYEYLNSGLPIAVGNMPEVISFVERHRIGGYVDLSSDIFVQIRNISKLNVPKNFLENYGLYLEDKGKAITELYYRVMNKEEY